MQYGLRLLTREWDHPPDIMHRSFSGIEIPGNKIGRAYGTLFILWMNFKYFAPCLPLYGFAACGILVLNGAEVSATLRLASLSHPALPSALCSLLLSALCSLLSAFSPYISSMVKHTLLLLSLLASFSLAAQRMELSGGVNFNTFYDNGGGGGHYQSDYTSHTGYALRLGVDEVMSRSWEFRFTLGYERYGGGLTAGDGGNGGGYYTKAEVDKSVLSFGFYPLNFKLDDHLDISIGIEGARLLGESVDGTYTMWTMGQPDKVTDLQDKYDRYSAPYCVGLQGRIAYEFRLSDRMMLVPQFTYYYGLSPEFEQSPEKAKSSRLFLGIGLTWDLTPAGETISQ